jgi:hypothetical protein
MVATDLSRESPADRLFKALSATPLVRRPDQGARIIVKVASDPALDGVTGRFFSSTPGAGFLPTSSRRSDPDLATKVYERTLGVLGLADTRSSAS